ncbi:protein phosphatase CheZ [Endothiovibrio diazotrophicus]
MSDLYLSDKELALERARSLVSQIEVGNEPEISRLLDELDRMRENNIFKELGKLTRELHDALKNFHLDSHLSDLAEKDIPDAKDRLNYVITMTEQAAHRTLNAVEESLPLSEQIEKRAGELSGQWERFLRKEMKAEEFRNLSRDLATFLNDVAGDSSRIHGNLSDVLMAQDFQDLTGQVIRRVITLVQDVEESLVGIIRLAGQSSVASPVAVPVAAAVEAEVPSEETVGAHGPAVPGVDHGDVVSGQDDVDELLASLGF